MSASDIKAAEQGLRLSAAVEESLIKLLDDVRSEEKRAPVPPSHRLMNASLSGSGLLMFDEDPVMPGGHLGKSPMMGSMPPPSSSLTRSPLMTSTLPPPQGPPPAYAPHSPQGQQFIVQNIHGTFLLTSKRPAVPPPPYAAVAAGGALASPGLSLAPPPYRHIHGGGFAVPATPPAYSEASKIAISPLMTAGPPPPYGTTPFTL